MSAAQHTPKASGLELPTAIEDALRRASPAMSRRNFLASSGALVLTVSVGAIPGGRALAQVANAGAGAGPYPDPDFRQLDTWIVIHPDNTATFFVGKTDGGQGTGTAFRQMMSDELDIAYDMTRLVMGRTDNGVKPLDIARSIAATVGGEIAACRCCCCGGLAGDACATGPSPRLRDHSICSLGSTRNLSRTLPLR